MRVSVALLALGVAAANPVVAHAAQSVAGVDAPMRIDDGESLDVRGYWQLGLERTFGSGWSFESELRLEGDFRESETLPDGPEQVARSSWNRKITFGDRIRLDARQVVLAWRDETEVRIGKQPLIWGRADGVQVLDVVSPRDYRSFVLEAPADSRIALWSARVVHPISDALSLEAFVIADPTVNVYPSQVGAYRFTSPRVVPQVERQASIVERPAASTMQGGARLAFSSSNLDDASIYWARLRHRNPRYRIEGDNVVQDFVPTDLLGLSLAKSRGALLGRFEATYTTRAPLPALAAAGDRNDVVAPELALVAGLDRSLPGDWLVSGQFYFKDPLEDSQDASSRAEQRAVTMRVRSGGFRRGPQMEVFAVRSLLDEDTYLRVELGFRLGRGGKLTLGTDQFFSNTEGFYGQYRALDQVFALMRWGF